MTLSIFNPQWLAAMQAGAQQPPRKPRQDLWLNGQCIGSVEPDGLMAVVPDGQSLRTAAFLLERRATDATWHITGQGTQALAHIAQALHVANVGCVQAQWRDEQLAVLNHAHLEVATVERGVTRWLGIATRAVHLLGFANDGRVWVQQRAQDKAIDPGLWDTLVGGMVPACDNLTTALQRETWEEAGIDINRVMRLHAGGRLQVARPNARDGGAGYVREQIDWFVGVIPDDVVPVNQDGEVAQFALLTWDELALQLEAGLFTLDAAMIFSAAHALQVPRV